MWRMPAKVNYTGIIGLVIQSPGNASNLVYFTAKAGGLPPSIENWQTNALLPFTNMQLPAQNGNGSNYWDFLWMVEPGSVQLNIGYYIIEMQTVEENTPSTPITVLIQQQYLFKVMECLEIAYYESLLIYSSFLYD
jgi:hypothetical protein